MPNEQVLPKVLIALGTRCHLDFENMGWSFKVDGEGDIVGSKILKAAGKKFPVTLDISEDGSIWVKPAGSDRWKMKCTTTKEEARKIRRELPGACDPRTQSIVEDIQDAGFGSRVSYCSDFLLSDSNLIIKMQPDHILKRDCFITIEPNGLAKRSCVPFPNPKKRAPSVHPINSFDPKAVSRVREILERALLK